MYITCIKDQYKILGLVKQGDIRNAPNHSIGMTVVYEGISKISTVTGGMTHATELTECDRHGRHDGRKQRWGRREGFE